MKPCLLNITEIFHSIQGESSFAGWPCAFIRLTGCGHGCFGCDTSYAESGGNLLSIESIIEQTLRFHAPLIEITGGEPLMQPAVHTLMQQLCNLNQKVLLETGGFLSVGEVDQRVHKIIDIKPPSSGVSLKNNYENIRIAVEADPCHRETFEFKIVIAEKHDYEWAKSMLHQYNLTEYCTVMMGVVFGKLEPVELAQWILYDRLNVRMQLQLHKYIWPHDMKGV